MPAADAHTATPMGVALTVRDAPAEVLAALAAGLERYPADFGLQGALDVSVRVHGDEPGDPAWPSVQAVDSADTLTVRCGSAVATLRYPDGTAVLDLPVSMLGVTDALRLFVESVFTALQVRRGALHAVHSALVSVDDVGLVLRGPSGAGKSTLTYSCLRRGLAVCSDDWIYAATHATPGHFAGYPWRMMMTEDAAARFPELVGAATVPHPAAEGRKVPVVPPVDQQLVTATAAAVVLLDPAPELSLQPVSFDEAVERFWAPALPTEREHLTDEWVHGLLDRPTYVLRRGTDPALAAQALIELARSLR